MDASFIWSSAVCSCLPKIADPAGIFMQSMRVCKGDSSLFWVVTSLSC
jgi:hypothetical protein